MTSIWSSSAGGSTVNANNTLRRQRFTATEGQQNFVLTEFSYVPATGSTIVFYNGSAQNLSDDYLELSSTEIKTLFQCNEGDVIDVIGFTGVSASIENVRLFNNTVTAILGQTQISTAATYRAGTASTAVYRNKLRLIPGVDYTEVDGANYITLVTPATGGDVYFTVVGQLVNDVGSEADLVSYNIKGTGGVSTTVGDILDAQLMVDYTALRAYTGLAKTVRITGLLTTAQPQGITGFFQYDQTDTTSADNGGTIIVGSDGRRWKRVFDGEFYVTWFGADKTGVSSSVTAFNNCLDALPATGGIIVFPPGTYRGNFLIDRSNVIVRGYGAKVITNGGTDIFLSQISGSIPSRVFIFGFELDGNNTITRGATFVRAVDSKIEDCKITQCRDHGIMITGDGIGACTHVAAFNNRINGSATALATAAGIYIGGGGVNAATRLFANYIADYPTSVLDAGVNTVDLGDIFETGVNAVISTGGSGVFIGNWVEKTSFSGKHFRIGAANTTIISPHDSSITDIDAFAAGQFPAQDNKILTDGANLLGNVILPDGGLQWTSTSTGGAIGDSIPKNFRGTIQVSGAATTATFTFVNAEPDADYRIVLTPVTVAGGAVVASTRIIGVSKTTTGFTITVEAAPGGVGIVTFDWILVR